MDSDTSVEEVASNTVEKQQLIEGRSYADAVAKGKIGNNKYSWGIILSGHWIR